MNLTNVVVAFLIAIGFTAWPIVGKYSGASGAWIGVITLGGATMVIALLSIKDMVTFPTTKAMAMLAIAAIANGIAAYAYTSKITDPAIQASVFVVTVSVCMAITTPLIDWCLNGTIPGTHKMAGFAVAILAIYLLGK